MSEPMWTQDRVIKAAEQVFRRLTYDKPKEANWFFELFGAGNTPYANRPFERFTHYDRLMRVLLESDAQKLKCMHKGTPYYFLGWTAFQMGRFETALIYMDLAVAEDMRANPAGWRENPAGSFMMLNPDGGAASDIVREIRAILGKQMQRHRASCDGEEASIDEFVLRLTNEFLRPGDSERSMDRSIVGLLYVFLLEFQTRFSELQLRCDNSGTIQPFVSHLFKGALLFESLLNHWYGEGLKKPTITRLFKGEAFKNDRGKATLDTTADDLNAVLVAMRGKLTWVSAFSACSKLRNTMGHRVQWKDDFNEDGNYQLMFEWVTSAILFLLLAKLPVPTEQE